MVTAAPDRFDFPCEEEKVLALWKELDAFQTSLRQSKDRPKYTFYDGPPFATGLPHYGHILAGTIKAGTLFMTSYSWPAWPGGGRQAQLTIWRHLLVLPLTLSQPSFNTSIRLM